MARSRSARRLVAAMAAASGLTIGLTGIMPGVPVTGIGGPTPVGAAPGQSAPGPVRLRLVSQSGLVEANGTFTARIDLGPLAPADDEPANRSGDRSGGATDGDTTGSDLQLAVTVHSVLDSAAGLDEAPTSALNRLELRPLDQAVIDDAGVMTLEMPIRSGEAFDQLERVRIPDPGVYPLTVEVRDGDTVLGSIRLNMIRLPGNLGPPVPATGSGSGPTDGARPTRDLALVVGVGQPGGLTVPEASDLLARHPGLAATVALRPGVLSGLEADPALAGSFARAVGERGVVVAPEPGLDPSALTAVGHGDIYLSAATATGARLAALGLTAADGVTMVASPLTTAGAELVASSGANLVFDISDTAPTPEPSAAIGSPAWAAFDGPGAVRLLRPIGRVPEPSRPDAATNTDPNTGTNTDPDRGATEGGPAFDHVAAAHDELARLMLGDPDDPPRLLGGFSPTPSGAPLAQAAVLGTLADLLDRAAEPAPGSVGGAAPRLGETRPLRLLTLGDAVRALPGEAATPAPKPAQDLLPVRDSLGRALDLLTTYDSFHAGGADDPASYRARLAAALSVSVDADDRVEWLAGMNRELDAGLTDISLPGNQSVTLAAQRVPIPLTLDSSASGDRRVLLRFRSDKIVVAEHGTVILVAPGTRSIDVNVEARSLGESPLEVTVLTPDGRHVLSTTRFRVRSTAVPGLGLAISGAGFGALAVWWYLSIKRRRRSGGGRRRRWSTVGGPTPDGDEGNHGGTGVPGDRAGALVGDSVKA